MAQWLGCYWTGNLETLHPATPHLHFEMFLLTLVYKTHWSIGMYLAIYMYLFIYLFIYLFNIYLNLFHIYLLNITLDFRKMSNTSLLRH